MRKLPFSVHDTECDIFIGRACTEMQKHGLVVAWFLDNLIRRSLGLVDEVGVENVELILVSD